MIPRNDREDEYRFAEDEDENGMSASSESLSIRVSSSNILLEGASSQSPPGLPRDQPSWTAARRLLRIRRAGYRIRFLTEARVVHHGGGSTRKYADFSLEWHRNRVRYFRKHFGMAGTWATRFAALIKAGEEVIRFLRAGRGFRSPEVRRIRSILREVLKT